SFEEGTGVVVRRSALQRSRATGFLGRSPEPFLHPFVGTKGCPRRVGVPTKAFYKTFPTGGDSKLFHERPAGSRTNHTLL
uniref:hypothetical protein n=1 Tax=Angelakisella sp. TaxID=1935177 RepID=UPI004027590B